ncbi:MAG: DUF4097 family beta strand repeat protein [Clostridia bacterium]|nr:DUF4097 family beta strand repeat protein [Clostridia bacterium]
MKAKSIIFLIIAAILIVGGIVTCIVCNSLASKSNLNLLSDTVDAQGNAITSDELADYGITSLGINMKDIDVNIISGAKESYVEFVNINPAVYDYTVSGYKMTLKTINPFDITSLVKFRKNGSGFCGLRSYFFLNKYDKVNSAVNIYISDDITLSEISVKLENGNVSIKNINSDCLYDFDVNNGDLKIDSVKTMLETTIEVKKGNLEILSSSLRKTDFSVEFGNVTFNDGERSQYYVSCKSGAVYLDESEQGDSVEGIIYPETLNDKTEESDPEATTDENESEQEELLSLPDEIKGSVTNGNIYINSKINE